jgi:nicotinate-nucleotide pyrophosphorylase (carboxylating)
MAFDLREIFIELLHFALSEDIGSGDVTTMSVIPEDAVGSFKFTAREDIVLSGSAIIKAAFPASELKYKDGDKILAGGVIANVKGNVRDILMKERSVLNIIQHLSGIATETARYVDAVKGTGAKILDTRKTLPVLRAVQKYAVTCGGGVNHRMGLYDAVLIKDNHIKAAGGINSAVNKARATNLKIEVECDSLEQAQQAIEAGADIILADNMSNEQLKEVVALAKGKVKIEASGNVNLQTVKDIAATGVDYISVGKLTHSVRAVDIGLDEA